MRTSDGSVCCSYTNLPAYITASAQFHSRVDSHLSAVHSFILVIKILPLSLVWMSNSQGFWLWNVRNIIRILFSNYLYWLWVLDFNIISFKYILEVETQQRIMPGDNHQTQDNLIQSIIWIQKLRIWWASENRINRPCTVAWTYWLQSSNESY